MENIHHPPLTSSELATIWNTYMSDSMGTCVLEHFINTVEDRHLAEILQFALNIAQDHIHTIEELFSFENIPIPKGFSKKDINPTAPRLFSDIYYARYLEHMGRTGLSTYALAKAISSRKDIRNLYGKWLLETEKLYDVTVDFALNNGTYIRPPYMDYPKEVKFAEEDFLGSYFGKNRSLLAIEIAHMGTNIEVCHVGQTLLMGFSQTSSSKVFREYFLRGTEIGKKQISIFYSLLKENNTSYPSTWDSSITSSIESPFSDRLMLFHTNLLSAIALSDFGSAIGGSIRRDIGMIYGKLILEMGKYAEDGAKLMVKEKWLELPPQTHDREKLIFRKDK